MALTVIGKEKVDYTNKNNVRIVGTIIHCTDDIPNSKGEGLKCSSEFVRDELASKVMIGDSIRIFYNKFGKVEDLEVKVF